MIEEGDLVYYERYGGVKRYAVVRFVKENVLGLGVYGIWRDSVIEAYRACQSKESETWVRYEEVRIIEKYEPFRLEDCV